MNGQRKSRHAFAVRLSMGLAAVTLLAAAVAGLTLARDEPVKAPDKPRVEDVDPNAASPHHKVTVDDADASDATNSSAPRAIDFARAAKDAKHAAVQRLFLELAVRHDVLKYNDLGKPSNGKVNIVPIPEYIGEKSDKDLEVRPFPATSWTPAADTIKVSHNTIEYVHPYEEIARKAVNDFLATNYEAPPNPKDHLSRFDQDRYAEQALTTVLLGLQSDRKLKARVGDDWQAVEDSLKQKLLVVLLEELDAKVKEGNWDEAYALTNRLAGSYRGQQDQEKIAAPLVGLVDQTLKQSTDEGQKAEARKRLLQLQILFPNSKALQPLNATLEKQANALFEEAKSLWAADPKGNRDHVARLINDAAQADPGLPELRDLRLKVSKVHPTLHVGVRELPTRMSPALAVTDGDLRANELLFESLVKLSPDGAGGDRWEPALAVGRPAMAPHGRQFTLPPNTFWSNHAPLTAVDVRFTVDLMRKGQGTGRPRVWGELLDNVVVDEASRVNLTLSQGWLDPLALMNFKVLPSSPDPTTEKFAERPLGSGPFMVAENIRTDNNGRPCVVFTANPYYENRPGKSKQPYIEQISFYTYTDPVAEFKAKTDNRLDLILDLTAKEAAALREKASDLGVRATAPTPPNQAPASPNRRIYFLAVNNGKPTLKNAAFRCALAYAVNRKELLDSYFRSEPGENLHAPLNGPYPARSWACKPDLAPDPFNVEQAKARLKDSGEQNVRELKLTYPTGDPAVKNAIEKLCTQVKDALGVTLTPVGLSPKDLRTAVEETNDYDLAYYHYDFPDDVYWLGPLLDPSGAHYIRYSGGLNSLIQDASRRRDFSQVREWTHTLHDKFLKEEMPFIPLWQLDPLSAVHRDIDIPPSALPFDPVLVFTDVERWELNRKP